MELWVAIRGVYDDTRVVGVSDSEEGAKALVREDYWHSHWKASDDPFDVLPDPMDLWDTGDAEGPYTINQLRKAGY
jgi:hypothetical protein